MNVVFFYVLLSFLFLLNTVSGAVVWQQVSPSLDLVQTAMIVSDEKGTLVMVQYLDELYHSAAGSNVWNRSEVNPTFMYSDAYGIQAFYFEDQFLVYPGMSDNKTVLSSPNGKVFTEVSLNISIGDVFMLSNNGTPIFVSYSKNMVFTSSNGFDWASNPFPDAKTVAFIQATKSVLFLEVYQYPLTEYYLTTDGYNYTILEAYTFGTKHLPVTFVDGAPGEVLAFAEFELDDGSYNASIFKSHDQGGSWSYVSTIGIGTQWALAYVDNSYVFFNSTARDSLEVLTSSDLMSWTEVPSLSINEELSLYRIQVVDEDLYIFLSSGYFYTTDLTTWFKYDIVAVYYEAIFVLPDTSFVLEGSLANHTVQFFSTLDGTNLSQLPPAPFLQSNYHWEQDGVYYFLEYFFPTTSLRIWTTHTFTNWSLAYNYPQPCQFTEVFIYGDNEWLGACELYANRSAAIAVYHASNPGTWQNVFTSDYWSFFSENSHSYDISYGNGIFVLIADGIIYTSPDGLKWSRQPTFLHENNTLVNFVGDLFFVTPWSSMNSYVAKDGISWTLISEIYMPRFVYSDTAQLYFAFESYYGRVWTSIDGVNWSDDEGYNLPTTADGLDLGYNGNTWIACARGAELFIGH